MDSSRDAAAVDVRRFNAALRQVSAALRARSVAARARSMSLRMQGRHYLPPPEPPTEPEAADGPVSLGSLQVSELFEILIDHHGFTVTGAVRALVVALEQAGYPAETSAVAAADGMEVIQSILDSRT